MIPNKAIASPSATAPVSLRANETMPSPEPAAPPPPVVGGHVPHGQYRQRGQARPLFEPAIVRRAIVDSFRKLHPRHQVRNPVMFVVEVGSVLTTGLFVQALMGEGEAPAGFILAVSLWLWFTVLF